MRQGNGFHGRYRSHERHFSNEAQFLKFAKARDEDDLTNPVFVDSHLLSNTTLLISSSAPETPREIGKTKGVSA
jgi:hypothetical protein